VFEPEPPFRIVAMSQRPILTGSEADGHAHDPRNIDSWKPFVVFPGGIVPTKAGYAVSYGINDHLTAIAEHTWEGFMLGDPTFATWGPKYFFTDNGGLPVRMFRREDQPAQTIRWERAKARVPTTCAGVMRVTDPMVALHLQEGGIEEISVEDYRQLLIA
jgi:hypothetical protein